MTNQENQIPIITLNAIQSTFFDKDYLTNSAYKFTKDCAGFLYEPSFSLKYLFETAKDLRKPEITYRKINDWYTKGLIKDNRENDKQWRKISAKDFVRLLVINDLKNYGLENAKVKIILSNAFDAHHQSQVEGYKEDKVCYFDFFFNSIMTTNIKIYLIIDIFGNTCYFTEERVAQTIGLDIHQHNPLLVLPFYIYCMPVSSQFFARPIKLFDNGAMLDNPKNLYSQLKEQFILDCIFNRDYSEINIENKSGSLIIKTQQMKKVDNLSDAEIINIIKSRAYQNIKILHRDGRTVALSIEEFIKI